MFSNRLHPLILSGGLEGFVFVLVFVLLIRLHPLILSGGLQDSVFSYVMMMDMVMIIIPNDDDDSHDGYTVAGIHYQHASHRSTTRVLEPATKPPQCSVNRAPPRTLD